MIIISDTTPIITLIKVNELSILKDLFGEIYIPREVYDELVCDDNYKEDAEILNSAEYITVKETNSDNVNKIIKETGLDRGESAAFSLYEEQKENAILIIDERKGREEARKRNIRITGTIGLLLLANKKNIRTKEDILNIIDMIKEKRNCYSQELFDEVIKELR